MKKINSSKKDRVKKSTKLQPLKLKQLEGLTGGVDKGQGTVECPACAVDN